MLLVRQFYCNYSHPTKELPVETYHLTCMLDTHIPMYSIYCMVLYETLVPVEDIVAIISHTLIRLTSPTDS